MSVVALIPPAWVLALILAALNVCVFHVAVARAGRSALYFMPFGILGFSAGNLVGWLLGSPLPMLGDVHVIEASIGAWVLLTAANGRAAP